MSKPQLLWRTKPVAADFDAAIQYLSLLNGAASTKALVAALRRETPIRHAAKDLLRASGLSLLPCDEPHVQADLKRIRKGKPLSPVLLVAGDMSQPSPLVVADGYHRICAVWYHDENAPISCLLARGSRGL
jgi:hypothetical protein